jgi:hypothetical protein
LQISGLTLKNESKGNGPPPQADSQSIPNQTSSKRETVDGSVTGSGATKQPKKKSKSKKREQMAARNRAIEFKRQFPEIEGIPTELGKKERKQILKKWKSKTKVPIEGRQEERDAVKHTPANTTFGWSELKAKALSTAGEIVLVPRIDRFPDKVKVRRAGAAKPLAGATRSDPIEVD